MALALATTAACGGSALSPEAVQSANAALNGVNGGAASGGVVDPGTGVVGGTGGTGTTGGVATGGTGGTGSTGGTGGTGSTGGTGGTGGGTSAPPSVRAGSCDGFQNSKGITDSEILIGNSSDISGPVPGLFAAAQQATKAYVAYFNSTGKICGRSLRISENLDSRTDAGADQVAYQRLCDNVFAAVGSQSAFDSGGASVANSCGLPDIRAAVVTAARNACNSCFGAQPTGPFEFSNAVPDYFVRNPDPKIKASSQKAAFLYLNAGAAAENAVAQQKVEEKRGMKFLYTQAIDVADFNYGPYVQQMKSRGVEWVQFIGAYQQSVRLAQAMQSANFKPVVRLFDPSVYDNNFLTTGGSAVEGATIFINFTPLEENQPEINRYKQWLQQVAPGATPTFFGMFAWSAAKLFVEESIKLGGKLNRASLVAAIKKQNNWTGGGMHGPMQVGAKRSPSCIRFLQVKGGKFVPLGSTKYVCNGSSVGR